MSRSWRLATSTEATALFREAIVLKRELGDRMGMAVGLDSLGRVATAEGRGERAALLLGAAEGIWDVVGMSETGNPFAFAPSRSDGLQQARKLLGKQRFRELFRRGSQLSLDEAVRFALEEKADAGPPSRAHRAVPADQAGAGGGRPGRRRAVQPGDRGPAGHLRAHRPGSRGEHPAQARVQLPVPDRRLGHRTPAGGAPRCTHRCPPPQAGACDLSYLDLGLSTLRGRDHTSPPGWNSTRYSPASEKEGLSSDGCMFGPADLRRSRGRW